MALENEHKGAGAERPARKRVGHRKVGLAVVAILVMIASLFIATLDNDASVETADYQQLDYIEVNSGGLTLIDTGLLLGDVSRVDLDITIMKGSGPQMLFVGTKDNIRNSGILVAKDVLDDNKWDIRGFGNNVEKKVSYKTEEIDGVDSDGSTICGVLYHNFPK